ncbi:MAG: hypothetical protein WCF65_09880, partial [Parachlamydiaceae bacterium]
MAEICEELQQAGQIIDCGYDDQVLEKKIEECIQTGGKLLIPGGWAGRPGHAMLYELSFNKKTNEGTLRIFNAGMGIEEHQQKKVGYKVKVCSKLEEHYSPESLKSQDFRVFLRQLKTHDSVLPYGPRDAYHVRQQILRVEDLHDESSSNPVRLKIIHGEYLDGESSSDSVIKEILGGEYLHDESSSDTEEFTDYVQVQRAGTCTFYSILAFLRSKLDPKTYKRFKCDLRLQALADHIFNEETFKKLNEAVSGTEPVSRETLSHFRVLDEGVKEMARKVNSLFLKKVVDQAYVVESHKTLDDMRRRLAEIKDQINLQPTAVLTGKYKPVTVSAPVGPPSLPLHDALGRPAPVLAPHSSTLEEINALTFTDKDTILKQLKSAVGMLNKALESKEFGVVSHGAVTVLNKLPLSQLELWSAVSPVDGMTLLQELTGLVLLGRRKGGNPGMVISEEIVSINKAIAIQVNLLREMHPFFKDKYLIPLDRVTRYLQLYHPQAHEDLSISHERPEDLRESSDIIFSDDRSLLKVIMNGGASELLQGHLWESHYTEALYNYFQQEGELLQKMLSTNSTQELLNHNKNELDLIKRPGFYFAQDLLPDEFKLLRNTLTLSLLAASPHKFNINIPEADLSLQHLISWNPWQPKGSVGAAEISFPSQNLLIEKIDGQPNRDNPGIFQSELNWFQKIQNPDLKRLARWFCPLLTDSGQSRFSPTDITLSKRSFSDTYNFLVTEPDNCYSDQALRKAEFFKNETIRELCHIFTSDNQRSEAIAYFNKHDCISDPDYQKLFMQMIFGHGKNYHPVT